MKNFRFVCCCKALLLISPLISHSQKKLSVFILAGQSNAQGWMGDGAYYPKEGKELDDSIFLNWTFIDNESSNGNWIKLQSQKGRFPKGHFGPEVSFARELKKAGYNPAIFKYTKGGTSLGADWKGTGEGGIYDRMVIDLKAALTKLEYAGYSISLSCFIWIQGESDAVSDLMAMEYYKNLNELIKHLRNNVLKQPELKVILGMDENHPDVIKRPVVVNAQKQLAQEDSTIIYSSMSGLSKADVTHLTPEGLIKHGKLIFKAFQSLSNNHFE